MITLQPRRNTSAETAAFDRTCERLGGFDAQLSFEWVDGFLTALAAGPRVPDAGDWLPALCGDDTFDRVFADPDDHAQALRALQARLKVLCELLDPEQLSEDLDQLRLDPWVLDWDDEGGRRLVEEDGFSEDEASRLQLGSVWADGFLSGVDAFPALWATPPGAGAQESKDDAIAQIDALTLAPDSDELLAHIASFYDVPDRSETPAAAPTRDDLLTEACFAVQALRMLWVDFAPRPETRRMEPVPGRNEPCFCGSGKKYKKCHGATA